MISLKSDSTSALITNKSIPLTSASLLLQVRDPANHRSWERFQNIYGPIIQAFCRRRGFQEADIDDISQEVLIAVVNSIRSFDYHPESGRFRSWLATVTANKSRNHVRRNQRLHEVSVDWIEMLADRPENDSIWNTLFVERIFAVACDNVRDSFEPNTWRCFELAWVERQPSREVASELGIPVYSVYVNKSRVLKRLEQEFRMLCDDHPNAVG